MNNFLVQQENAEKALGALDFDHPFRVTAEGTIADDVSGIYAPDVLDEVVEGPWQPITGYSRQDRYSSPVMHDSEYLGGAMLRDMLEQPGIYVQVACYWSQECDTCCEDENGQIHECAEHQESEYGPTIEGWMLLKYSKEA